MTLVCSSNLSQPSLVLQRPVCPIRYLGAWKKSERHGAKGVRGRLIVLLLWKLWGALRTYAKNSEIQTYSSLTGPMKEESSAFFGDYVEEIVLWANLHGLQVVTMVMVSLSKATHDQDNQPMRCVNWTASISTQHALCLQIKSVLWKQLWYVISGDWCCGPF